YAARAVFPARPRIAEGVAGAEARDANGDRRRHADFAVRAVGVRTAAARIRRGAEVFTVDAAPAAAIVRANPLAFRALAARGRANSTRKNTGLTFCALL